MSILRYAGGKSRAIKILKQFLPHENISTIISPFCGGASFELQLAYEGKRVYASDVYEPVVNFWSQLKNNRPALISEIEQLHQTPISKTSFYYLRDTVVGDVCNIFKNVPKAAAFFAVNRCSFSGTTCSGGYSNEAATKRFTLSSVDRLRNVDLSNIYFQCMDFEVALQNARTNTNAFLFLDPPYALNSEKSNLYGNRGSTHKGFDHDRLFRVLSVNQNRWMLCYNDCEYIRALYQAYHIAETSWSYGMSAEKKGKELVITNY